MKRNAIRTLARWMDEHEWSQLRLAAYVGRSQAWISEVMRGEATVGLEVGMKLAELTNIPLEDIVTDKSAQRILESYVDRLLAKRGIAKEIGNVA